MKEAGPDHCFLDCDESELVAPPGQYRGEASSSPGLLVPAESHVGYRFIARRYHTLYANIIGAGFWDIYCLKGHTDFHGVSFARFDNPVACKIRRR